ncbi:MAG: hypothetical protein Q4P24_18185, partial [Rhodobacterales bacterium]|nr:hypothetical protein [Rhodobacterales bacterium]
DTAMICRPSGHHQHSPVSRAFKIAGLTPHYAEQFRSITSAVNESIGAFAGFGSAAEAFALQPDLVGGIGSLLERALAQQEALLEQQRQVVVETLPRRQTLIAEQLTIINAIVAILFIMLFVYVMLDEHSAGGDAATLANAAAIEENTRTLEQMRGSYDALADQLERMRSTQEEASEEERDADAAIAGILREIADTLTEQGNRQEEASDRPYRMVHFDC